MVKLKKDIAPTYKQYCLYVFGANIINFTKDKYYGFWHLWIWLMNSKLPRLARIASYELVVSQKNTRTPTQPTLFLQMWAVLFGNFLT